MISCTVRHLTRRSLATMVLAALILGSWAMAQTRIIPHLTRPGGGFETTLILANQTTETAAYTLTPFDEDGNALTPVSGTLAASSTAAFPAAEILPNASHVLIVGDAIQGTASYQAVAGSGSPAQVPESTTQATSYRLYAGNWDTIFDGFAVVNLGDTANDVWVVQRGYDGTNIQSVKALSQLAPNAKGLYIIGQPSGSEFEYDPNSYFEVYADQTLAITALRGNIPGSTFLWTNEAEIDRQATLKRDELGIWFIEDGSQYDIFNTMGYAIAQDRLFQLDNNRRLARGLASEAVGDGALALDIFVRTTNYTTEEMQEGWDNLDLESRAIIQAYTDGINRYISEVNSNPDMRPWEFDFVGLPDAVEWTPLDVLAWGVAVSRNFDGTNTATAQTRNVAILQTLLADYPEEAAGMFDDVSWINDPDAITMFPGESQAKRLLTPKAELDFSQFPMHLDFQAAHDALEAKFEAKDAVARQLNVHLKLGSYAWVVSGEKTASGNPILYAGPQMGFGQPSFIVEGSVKGAGFDMSGMFIPGLPFMVIGRTHNHAWSLQTGHAHGADLYFEDPAVLEGEPHHTEVIPVRGSFDFNLDVYRTEHGPIILDSPIVLAWKYGPWGKEFNIVRGFTQMAKAQTIEEFDEGVHDIPASLHVCYADTAGDIAYWMTGWDAVRPEGDFRVVQGVFGPPLEYDTSVRKPLPHGVNPARGYIGGWNSKATPDTDDGPFISFGIFHRGQLIQDYLEASDSHTFESIRDLNFLVATTDGFAGGGYPWPYLRPYVVAAVDANPTPERQEAIDILDDWHGHFPAGDMSQWVDTPDLDDGFALWEELMHEVFELTFADEIGDIHSLFETEFNTLLHHLDPNAALKTNYDWFTNQSNPSLPQTAEETFLLALDEAMEHLGPRPWGTDARGEISYQPPANPFLVLPTTPFGNRATYAQVVEMGSDGPVRIESMFQNGQSGNYTQNEQGEFILDPNYLSMKAFFDAYLHRDFPVDP